MITGAKDVSQSKVGDTITTMAALLDMVAV